ncbi:TIGR03758 family integrating conjugative element protein [Porticoccus sp. GXU_MW_L64]
MAITAAQESAFTGATLGLPMSSFSTAILLILYSLLYIWLSWVIVTQWRAWARRKIDFFDFLIRAVRSVVLTLVLGFLL